jgi:hypothetical protein
MMEDILREPLELTESELDEIAGGGCEQSRNPCGCEGSGLAVVIGVAVGIGIVLW